ncbi:diacylglycerol kinase family lipid kinase [Mucilaginibacter rubeus]|uniref:Diacylglycerol kinase family lipid kinase n=1 Tax=Mucilaginibacter rubeus TaxID=2027860 RepID=A0AAE6JH78_9SPHI|nr:MULTISPECIES: diacylglycerol kinase family protein [Mucilaginibacter]QEM05485.1 diacylglycerol kinase family lipid kinase [Mucilaginibacter rubeus]QEM18069.1 diacylglycerol kinase family lipid kinase [Mucilaginibacter gossypii]QTE45394.1 diacylglycerol kinase family lipid kinase [Mucilaginibacter rubeus]QTE51991.1 diacylglycerol kinase family lipid kinase [Mucilaginibacter rubeus]QTE57080.1 diacylglycerol kinase family lipid kinase [Mucilaginibacter rubeus]
MKRKALFIINPISGGKKKDGVPELIKDTVDAGVMEPVIAFSDGVAHARVIAAEAVGKFDTVVAVGGDGTVNEVASAIVDTDTSLGIVPFGSGNGLSRFLGIPMDTRDAIKNLASGRTEIIDSARINGQPFFNMAGMGFDAHISEIFSHGKKRGFISYIKSSIKEVVGYQPQNYHLDIDGKKYDYKAFMLSIANSSQYGNNVHISPKASLQDGLLDVCVIKPFPLWRFPEMSVRMLIKATESSKYVEIIRGKQILIKREHTGPIHLDGEPQVAGTGIDINILPKSLKVIVGPSFKN